MPKRNDGLPYFAKKKRTGIKFTGWICIVYSKILYEQNGSIMVRLRNKEEAVISKQRSVTLKSKKKIYVQPEHYERDLKHLVEKN